MTYLTASCPDVICHDDETTRCDICQRVLPAAEVLRIGDTAVCDACREEYTG
jgi:hypothetical protein